MNHPIRLLIAAVVAAVGLAVLAKEPAYTWEGLKQLEARFDALGRRKPGIPSEGDIPGKEIMERASKTAESGQASLSAWRKAYEDVLKGAGVLRMPKPDRDAQADKEGAMQFLEELEKLMKRTGESVKTNEKVLAEASKSIKEHGTLTGPALEKIFDISPQLGEELAKAFSSVL